MRNGAVWLETARGIKRIRRAKKSLTKGELLHFYYDEQIQQTCPPAAALIADEGAYSVWHKPYGMYSQGTKWGDHCTIYRWAEQHLQPQRPAFPVHRLDRAASGLILLAHKKSIAAAFAAMFQQHTISKQYRVKVAGLLKLASLPYILDTPLDNKPAITEIVQIHTDTQSGTSELIINIKTGRKHQIRRHLASINHPVIGDRLYGIQTSMTDNQTNLQLKAIYLSFICPLRNQQKIFQL